MSDTPLPPDSGDDFSFGDPLSTGAPGAASGADGGPADGGADAFFGTFDDGAFEPALDAASFDDGADAFFSGAEASAPDAATFVAPAPEAPAEGAAGDGASADAEAAIVAAPARKGKKSKKAKAKRSRGTAQPLLGVRVTPTHVHGVLLQSNGDGGFETLRTLSRRRSEGTEDVSGATTPADAVSFDTEDQMVQFGGGQELDFTGEFDGIATDAGMDIDVGSLGQPRVSAQPIVFELKDMLGEIEGAGFDRPAISFAVSPPDVEYAEVIVPADSKKAKKASKSKRQDGEPEASAPVKRDKLVALLPDVAPGKAVDAERAAFLAMTPREGRPRYLALLPQPTDPVVSSLSMLREHSKHRRTAFKTIEAEVPLLVGLSGLVCPSEAHENTAVVRVGTEDTLVLLLAGGVLHHMEPMQSVTAHDGPDTICSRVLLQQDVQGVGTVHNVLVLSEEREDELVKGFAAFYPDARVSTFSDLFAAMGIVGAVGSNEASGAVVPGGAPLDPNGIEAAAVAVASVQGKGSPFADTSLLPKELRKKRSRVDLSFGWHTMVVAVLLFLSVVFFVGLYASQASDIAERERTLAEFPPEATLEAPQLQLRIDSLRAAQAELTAALGALDSLLYGSDRWTQELVRTSRAASAAGGTWFEDITPGAAEHTISGYSTSRARVVSLAQRLGATIEEVRFSEVRDFPVYEWRIIMPSPVDLPQTAKYLREQLGEPIPPPRDALVGLDAAAPGFAPADAAEAADEAAPPPPEASGDDS